MEEHDQKLKIKGVFTGPQATFARCLPVFTSQQEAMAPGIKSCSSSDGREMKDTYQQSSLCVDQAKFNVQFRCRN